MKKLINKLGIKMAACVMVAENPNMEGWKDANHYKCTLTRRNPRRQMTVFFSMGYAHRKEPEAAEVLDCLASNSSSIESCRGFEDWARDLGYDIDNRKAERIFKACEQQAEKLQQFMGDEYEKLLYETERL